MLFGAMAEGRADDAFELLSDDIHWRVAGDLAFCGPHKGKQAVKDNLLSAISARYVPGTTNIKILNLFEDLNRSVVISQILESADLVGGGHTEAEIASFFLRL